MKIKRTIIDCKSEFAKHTISGGFFSLNVMYVLLLALQFALSHEKEFKKFIKCGDCFGIATKAESDLSFQIEEAEKHRLEHAMEKES